MIVVNKAKIIFIILLFFFTLECINKVPQDDTSDFKLMSGREVQEPYESMENLEGIYYHKIYFEMGEDPQKFNHSFIIFSSVRNGSIRRHFTRSQILDIPDGTIIKFNVECISPPCPYINQIEDYSIIGYINESAIKNYTEGYLEEHKVSLFESLNLTSEIPERLDFLSSPLMWWDLEQDMIVIRYFIYPTAHEYFIFIDPDSYKFEKIYWSPVLGGALD